MRNISLWLVCPGLIHFQNFSQMCVHQHGSQLPGPQPTPVRLVCVHLEVLLLWPTACSCSAFSFLPHWTFLLSVHRVFFPSYQKSTPHFPLLVPLIDPAYTRFAPPQRKATQENRLLKLWELQLEFSSRLWSYKVSENKGWFKMGCLDRSRLA